MVNTVRIITGIGAASGMGLWAVGIHRFDEITALLIFLFLAFSILPLAFKTNRYSGHGRSSQRSRSGRRR